MLPNIVGFVFAFRISLTFLFFQSDPAQGSAATVLLSVVLFLTALMRRSIDPLESRDGISLPLTVWWIGIYLVLVLCSLAWTTVPSLPDATAYWLAMAADVGTILLLVYYRPMARQAHHIMQGFVIGTSMVGVIAWCIPAMDDLRLGNEDFLHPNAIGFELAIAALFAFYLAHSRKYWTWFAAGLAITLLRDLSKTCIAAFVLAALFYLLQDSQLGCRSRIAIGAGVTLVVVSFWTILEAYADIYSQSTNVETLTGRTVIWATSLEIALEKPWIGHGFYSFRWTVPLFGDFEAGHAHNELLQQFFAYGVLGVAVVVILYWVFFRQIRATPSCGLKTLALALLIFALVRGLVDTERFDLSYPLWLIALLSASLYGVAMGEAS